MHEGVFTRPNLTGMSNRWRPLGISAGEADLHGTGLGDRTHTRLPNAHTM